LTTARLVLEPAALLHAPAMHGATVASREHLMTYLPWAERNAFEDTLAYLGRAEEAWRAGTAFSFAVFLGGALIGDIAIRRTFNNPHEGNIGYWIAASAAGKGYGTEAAQATVEFGFSNLGLARQELRTHVDNVASQRVAAKIGMQREARLREGVHPGHDGYLYAMTASDPRP
jgi:RimJ/RimL family protein N-acetyltransferase